jgi:hypothetical protein
MQQFVVFVFSFRVDFSSRQAYPRRAQLHLRVDPGTLSAMPPGNLREQARDVSNAPSLRAVF